MPKIIEPAGWKSPDGSADYLATYLDALELWPVPYESLQIPTRFGDTHVIASGSPNAPPLVATHAATGFGALQWHLNAKAFSEHHRFYAVDYIGSAGMGTMTKPMYGGPDCRIWLKDVFDGLDLDQVSLIGSSQGGWIALNFALGEPTRLSALALLAPAASILPFRWPVVLSLKMGPYQPAWTGKPSIKAMMRSADVDDRLVRLLALHLQHFRYQKRAPFPHAFSDDQIRSLQPPTLLLIGDHEVIYNREEALRRAKDLVPLIQTELVPDAGHIINMEQPEFTNDRVLSFLAQTGKHSPTS